MKDLSQRKLVTSSKDRDLTDSGRRIVEEIFSNTIDIGRVVRIVELREGKPHFSELDCFVFEASDVVYVLSTDEQKEKVNDLEAKMSICPGQAFYLGGIHVLREAAKVRMITVNPEGSPKDQCDIGYNNQ